MKTLLDLSFRPVHTKRPRSGGGVGNFYERVAQVATGQRLLHLSTSHVPEEHEDTFVYIQIHKHIHPSISISLSIYLSICLSLYLIIYLCIHIHWHLSVYLSSYLSIYPFIYLWISICMYHLNLFHGSRVHLLLAPEEGEDVPEEHEDREPRRRAVLLLGTPTPRVNPTFKVNPTTKVNPTFKVNPTTKVNPIPPHLQCQATCSCERVSDHSGNGEGVQGVPCCSNPAHIRLSR